MFVTIISSRLISHTNTSRATYCLHARASVLSGTSRRVRIPTTAGYYTVNGQHESHHVGHSQRSLAAVLKESRGQSALCRQLVTDWPAAQCGTRNGQLVLYRNLHGSKGLKAGFSIGASKDRNRVRGAVERGP